MSKPRSDRFRIDRFNRRVSRRVESSRFRALSPRAEPLELRIVPAVDVWTGASSNLWSDNGNWQDNSAPTTGEDLVFPASASNKTSVYDSGLGVSDFGSIDIQDNGYDISRPVRLFK